MKIMIESLEGPRPGAAPSGGINDTTSLVKALLSTLALEKARGNPHVVLDIDMKNLELRTLVEVVRSTNSIAGGSDYDAILLVKGLLLTLADKRARGHAQLLLDIELENLRPELLMEIARSVSTTRRGFGHAV